MQFDAPRGILRLEDIVRAQGRLRMVRIDLDQDLLGHAQIGIRRTHPPDSTIAPPGVTSTASTIAKSIVPKKP
jgi:hypothetical protein